MDPVTHGLLGAAVGALPPRRNVLGAKPALLVGVAAGLLPDIDYLIPANDAVLHTLKAHRGYTHALVAAPVVALVATLLVKLLFRSAPLAPLYTRALIAVPLAHLLPDLWTGWGTRLFLPFSDRRVALDWTMVVDPYFTVPLVVAAGWALWRRGRWRRALLVGVAISVAYLGLRIVIGQHLEQEVRARYPQATTVDVFPAPLRVLQWRYVVRLAGDYATGSVGIGRHVEEQSQLSAFPTGPVPPELAAVPTVHEALAWARFPVVRVHALDGGGHQVRIADLRYHLRGTPTLTFVVDVAEDRSVSGARLDRGGTAAQLLRRWRGGAGG